MGNDFINYLNSMNNASGENINSLAESQVTNKYYDNIRINRKLGEYIVNKINSGELKSYIITGHAGDGKTSILVQILKELNLLNNGEGLKIQETKQNDNIKLMYVKDMSELSESEQIDLLKSSLDAPKNGKSSILISNTGPLIKSFIKLFAKDDEGKDNIENKLLKQLDSNECSELEIENNKFYLINMARIENVGFVKEIINKICSDNLWEECKECSNKDICPAYFNKLCVQNNSNRVIRFIEMYYRWLLENDKRVTIRQMLSQISFAFTGNIDCSEISTYYKSKYIKFNLNFANLFFGYKGIARIKDSDQINGIRLINEMNLDDSAFEEDYEIFVKENFSYFSKDIENEVKNIWKEYNKQIFEFEREDMISLESKQNLIRKAIRRFFLMYGLSDDITKEGNLYNQIYGKNFYEYVRATTSKLSRRELKQFTNSIYQALFIKNVGVPPCNNTDLYLTLTRNDSPFQSVLLMLAKANEKDLEVKQFNRNIDIEDVEKSYVLKLIIKGKEEFKLSLPILIYFYSLVDGEVNTEINPSLSHGLAELNAKLIKNFRNNEYDSILSLIVNTINGVKEVEIEITEDDIYFGI